MTYYHNIYYSNSKMQLAIKHEVSVYLSTIRYHVEVFKYQEMEISNEISPYISNLKFLLVINKQTL